MEGNRDREFNPVKNADGSDSPATAKAALRRIYHEWATSAGLQLSASHDLEISPLSALDAEELQTKLADGRLTIDDITS